VGEWACGYAPDLLGLTEAEMELLNDDRVGCALDKLTKADHASLALSVAAHVVKRFHVQLDQLHNDSTTISFFGAYDAQGLETPDPDHPELVSITWGHSKDHRPNLKQLLTILTVSRDGAIPIHYRAASGNVTDDVTRHAYPYDCRRRPRPATRPETTRREIPQNIASFREKVCVCLCALCLCARPGVWICPGPEASERCRGSFGVT